MSKNSCQKKQELARLTIIFRSEHSIKPTSILFHLGNKKGVELLIKSGAHVIHTNSDNKTALHFAASNGNIDNFILVFKHIFRAHTINKFWTILFKCFRKCDTSSLALTKWLKYQRQGYQQLDTIGLCHWVWLVMNHAHNLCVANEFRNYVFNFFFRKRRSVQCIDWTWRKSGK